MNSAVNELTRSVIDKDSIHECSVDELEELTRQYPYFGPGQFLLARKLKEENSPLYEQQSQKAILFFQDHLWFDYLSGNDDITGRLSAATPHEPIAQQVTQVVSTPVITSPAIVEEPPPLPSEKMVTETAIERVEIEPVEIASPVAEETIQVKEVEEPPVIEVSTAPELTTNNNSEAKDTNTGNSETEEDEEVVADQSGPPIKFPEFKIEPIDVTKPLSFEPFHTVDYFASQGINFKEEEKPKDKFSRQLKSFTEWLKAMKKLPDAEIAAPSPVAEDQRVTQMAEHSIADREVFTEAMADVWEKQENYTKAIEVYRKLSLLNPAKSSYFAAKIEQLKRR